MRIPFFLQNQHVGQIGNENKYYQLSETQHRQQLAKSIRLIVKRN